eukprot:TRINITY_DN3_c0_g4_i1.p1 TRINITY_DN3_c0_g4~~TRINITY_DN3_c0_g4_i1.p1  ORF type:complete len:538 (-),score=167.08 TRINITY_DN3_c0_g4_i1:21-1595(-)
MEVLLEQVTPRSTSFDGAPAAPNELVFKFTRVRLGTAECGDPHGPRVSSRSRHNSCDDVHVVATGGAAKDTSTSPRGRTHKHRSWEELLPLPSTVLLVCPHCDCEVQLSNCVVKMPSSMTMYKRRSVSPLPLSAVEADIANEPLPMPPSLPSDVHGGSQISPPPSPPMSPLPPQPRRHHSISPPHSPPPQLLESMPPVATVAEWLVGLGCAYYLPCFEQHKVTLETIREAGCLSKEMLHSIGIIKQNDVKVLMKASHYIKYAGGSGSMDIPPPPEALPSIAVTPPKTLSPDDDEFGLQQLRDKLDGLPDIIISDESASQKESDSTSPSESELPPRSRSAKYHSPLCDPVLGTESDSVSPQLGDDLCAAHARSHVRSPSEQSFTNLQKIADVKKKKHASSEVSRARSVSTEYFEPFVDIPPPPLEQPRDEAQQEHPQDENDKDKYKDKKKTRIPTLSLPPEQLHTPPPAVAGGSGKKFRFFTMREKKHQPKAALPVWGDTNFANELGLNMAPVRVMRDSPDVNFS